MTRGVIHLSVTDPYGRCPTDDRSSFESSSEKDWYQTVHYFILPNNLCIFTEEDFTLQLIFYLTEEPSSSLEPLVYFISNAIQGGGDYQLISCDPSKLLSLFPRWKNQSPSVDHQQVLVYLSQAEQELLSCSGSTDETEAILSYLLKEVKTQCDLENVETKTRNGHISSSVERQETDSTSV
jgi:hypothetical protein